MGLNESKGNMYSWVTHTCNTIKGECPHGCTYCYMKRWGKQKPIHFDRSELQTDLGSGRTIFVGSSCDMFAEKISWEWILNTLLYCQKYNDNTYLFQSKNPKGFDLLKSISLPDYKLCTTIETNRHYSEIMKKSPKPVDRAIELSRLNGDKYVTIEPIMDFDLKEMVELIKLCHPNQVNIGADSGNNHLPEPSKEKILELIDELKKFTVIDEKRNLKRLLC